MISRSLTGISPNTVVAFGARSIGYPEYCAAMLAVRATGQPIKWISRRVEAFLEDNHGRGSAVRGELALDAQGSFLALRLDWIAEIGAYMTPTAAVNTMRNPISALLGLTTAFSSLCAIRKRRMLKGRAWKGRNVAYGETVELPDSMLA